MAINYKFKGATLSVELDFLVGVRMRYLSIK